MTTEQHKEKAIATVQAYQNKLLEDFFAKATELNEKLSNFLETGADNEKLICLKSSNIQAYRTISRQDIINLKSVLDSMNENKENAIKIFDTFHKSEKCIAEYYLYKEFYEVEDLFDKYGFVEEAKNFIKM